MVKGKGSFEKVSLLRWRNFSGIRWHRNFSSKKINCPHCNCRNHRKGTTTYFHGCVTPRVVSPNQKQVINLEPEFIKKTRWASKTRL
jgi:hypothetical protein